MTFARTLFWTLTTAACISVAVQTAPGAMGYQFARLVPLAILISTVCHIANCDGNSPQDPSGFSE